MKLAPRTPAGVAAGALVLLLLACSAQYENAHDTPDGGVDAGDDSEADGAAAAADANVNDAPSNADAGADQASPTNGAAGFALAFDGKVAHVESAFIAIPQNFTVEAWVEPASFNAAGENEIFAEDEQNAADQLFRLGLDSTGHLFFVMSDSAGSTHGLRNGAVNVLSAPSPLPLGKFSHVAVTKNATVFSVYVDDALVSSLILTDFVRDGPATQLRIGARIAPDGTSPTDVFAGMIDEVRLWNVARTATQLHQDAPREIALTDADFASLVSYWKFDEGTGSTTTDSRTNAGGNLIAAAWVKSMAF
jgi:hypothetical protein